MMAGSIGNPVNGLVLGDSVGVGEGASVAVAAAVMVATVVGAVVLVAVTGNGVSVGAYFMSTCVVAVADAGAAVTDGVLLHAVLSANKIASDTNRVLSVTGKGFIQFSPWLVVDRDAICGLIAGAMPYTPVVPR